MLHRFTENAINTMMDELKNAGNNEAMMQAYCTLNGFLTALEMESVITSRQYARYANQLTTLAEQKLAEL
jgi:hypothetical protein